MLRRKEPEIIILGKNQVKKGKGPHHGTRGTAWTGRVTFSWEPDSVKPGGLIKITIKKNRIGVDQYKKTLESTKSKTQPNIGGHQYKKPWRKPSE